MTRSFATLCLSLALVASAARADDADFSKADLNGSWYVLIHYTDAGAENKDAKRFKDFAWTIEQTANTITWEYYPFVFFGEDSEPVRRQAMKEATPWEPSASEWAAVRQAVDVSSRALQRKRMTGTAAQGFKSLAPLGTGGLNTMSFSRNWDVTFKPEKVSIVIVDSLSGSGGLEGMEEATIYEINERASADEYRGTYTEGDKRGTLRMVRSAERRVVK
jgi:hypothetical protein